MKDIVLPNKHLFDCRRYIRPGDRIVYDSMKACDNVGQVDRSNPLPYEATVIKTYESFVIVKLKKITECVNRWDISKINDRHVGNKIGYFGGMPVRVIE